MRIDRDNHDSPSYREQRPVESPKEEVKCKLLWHEKARKRIVTRCSSHVGGRLYVYRCLWFLILEFCETRSQSCRGKHSGIKVTIKECKRTEH